MTDSHPSAQRDAEYLARLQDYYSDWKSIPSYAALCDVFGIASKSWVKAILDRLGEAGFLERTPDGMWIPTREFFARPLADSSVPAGMPVTVSATGGEYYVLDEMLIEHPSQTTLIPVKGDSMIDAGIDHGIALDRDQCCLGRMLDQHLVQHVILSPSRTDRDRHPGRHRAVCERAREEFPCGDPHAIRCAFKEASLPETVQDRLHPGFRSDAEHIAQCSVRRDALPV